MFKFRDYQKRIVRQGSKILKNHNLLYLTMEVRTGKTFTSLGICNKIKANNVLFITKKKAISSIEDDFNTLKPNYKITVINYESLHKISTDQHFDVLILDEAHSIGAYPKKNKRCLQIQSLILIHDPKVILLSGTPTPESFSQMYHQVCSIPGNPFSDYKNFYQFCKHHVDVKQRRINGLFMNDYSRGRESILKEMKPYTISFTQKEAGFVVDTNEEVLWVDLEDSTKEMISSLAEKGYLTKSFPTLSELEDEVQDSALTDPIRRNCQDAMDHGSFFAVAFNKRLVIRELLSPILKVIIEPSLVML